MNNYKFEKTTNDAVSELREEYLMSLTDPIDGMWTTFVMMSDQYMIITGDKKVGYCSINEEHKVLQFYAINDQDYIYAKMLEELDVKGAVVGTNEQHHLSLSMDNQKSVSVNALLYQCEEGIELIEANFPDGLDFRNVTVNELQTAVNFAVSAIGAPEGWLQGYYAERIKGGELIGLWDGSNLIATGECRPSAVQKPYADLGMVVSPDHRQKGLATEILREMLHNCRAGSLKPICSTESGNIGARKAITNAGFTSHLRILDVSF